MLLPDLSYLTPVQQAAFLAQPALAPPDGITQNLTNPPNSNTLSITITVLALLLSSIFVFIRLYVSLVVSKEFFLTDGKWLWSIILVHKIPRASIIDAG
jgi:hypothetical protein